MKPCALKLWGNCIRLVQLPTRCAAYIPSLASDSPTMNTTAVNPCFTSGVKR
jgi:hypothetical protein